MGTIASPDASTAPDREVLTWQGFGDASRELTRQIVASEWIPDLIVAIAWWLAVAAVGPFGAYGSEA